MYDINKFMGKCAAATTSGMNTMIRSMGNCKQDGKIAEHEKTVSRCTSEIGSLIVSALDHEDEKVLGVISGNAAIEERYAAILSARKQIEKADKSKIIKKVTCPVCGAKTSSEMHFCGKCGAPLLESDIAVPAEVAAAN